MIDVIIPAYNAHKTIKKTLSSIAYQQNVKDIKVYIVNDASKKDYREEINFFSSFMKIKELKLLKNKGPGYARQYGIEHSNSDYIVFIDADDVLYDSTSLEVLYKNIENTQADVLISSFYEELYDETLCEHKNDFNWMHGKIYKRKFLEKNNIKFNYSRASEDIGFNRLISLYNSKIEIIDDFTYIWCLNKKSITCKRNYKYSYSGFNGYIYNITWALEKAIDDNCEENKIAILAFSAMISMYYYYLHFKNNEGIEKQLDSLKKLCNIHFKYPVKDENEKKSIIMEQYNVQLDDISTQDLINPIISFDEFIEHIKRKKEMIIAFSCNRQWYYYLIIDLYSLLENTKNIKKIYLLVETENIYEIPYLNKLKEKYSVEFKLIDFNKYKKKYIKNDFYKKSIYTDFCFGKLLLPEIVKEDKVLYIDVDAIVRKDISEVWNYNIFNYYVAGVKDYGIYTNNILKKLNINGKYINSGFVLFNLKKIRKDNIQKKWFNIINSNNNLEYPDQDALNKICTNNELYLPSMYNYSLYNNGSNITLEVMNKDLIKVYHYAGSKEQWVVDRFYAEEWYDAMEKFMKEFNNKNYKEKK